MTRAVLFAILPALLSAQSLTLPNKSGSFKFAVFGDTGTGEREEIEVALVRRVPMRRIARRYGVSKSAVGRHIRSHVAEELLETMRERVEAQRVAEGGLPPALQERLRIERERVATLLNRRNEK